MPDFVYILANRRPGSQEWVTLLIFIIIIAVNALSGILKAAKNKREEESEDKGTAPPQRRYKPAEQWDSRDKTAQPKPRQQGLSLAERAAIEAKKRLEQQRLAQQRLAHQLNYRESLEQQKRREKLAAKRQERVRQQKLLEKQKQQLLAQQRKVEEIKKLKKARQVEATEEVSAVEFDLANMPVESLQNAIVACEILGKPVALREAGEKAF